MIASIVVTSSSEKLEDSTSRPATASRKDDMRVSSSSAIFALLALAMAVLRDS